MARKPAKPNDDNVVPMRADRHVEDTRLTDAANKVEDPDLVRPGRPTVMTPYVVDVLTGAIRRGASLADAARVAGVSEQAVHNWKRRALEALHAAGVVEGVEYSADEALSAIPESEHRFVEFWWKYRVAESFGVIDALDKIRRSPDWHAHAFLLKSRRPDEYGERRGVDSGAGPLEPSAARNLFMDKIDRLMQQGNAIDVSAKPVKPAAPKKRKAVPRKAAAPKKRGTA